MQVKRRMTRLLAFRRHPLLVAIPLVVLFYLVTSPVALDMPLSEDDLGEPRALFSPLRNQTPERIANQALLAIKNGNCRTAVAGALEMNPQQRDYLCGLFAQHHLLAWNLRNRTDYAERAELYFWHEGTEGIWVTIQQVDGAWQLRSISAVY